MNTVAPPPARAAEEDPALASTTTLASQVGAALSAPEARAADALRSGFELMLEKLGQRQTAPAQLQGNLFEYIEAARFNASAARQGSPLHAHVTAATPGQGTSKVDIEIRQGPDVVQRVQAKSSANHVRVAQAFSADEHYAGQQKLTNPENAAAVRRLAAKAGQRSGNIYAAGYRDTARNVTGELKAGGIRSGGTSHAEATEAAEHPRRYVAEQNLRGLSREVAVSARNAFVAGAVVTGAMSLMRNSLAVYRGQMSAQQAAGQVAQETLQGAVKGAAAGALGAGLRYTASALSVPGLSQGHVAAALAAGLIDTGVHIYAYARGEITAKALQHRLAHTGLNSITSVYYGSIGNALLGPAFGMVGGFAAYIMASHIYQVCYELDRRAQLATAEAERLTALAQEAIKSLQAQRADMENLLATRLQARRAELHAGLASIEAGLETGDHHSATLALAGFAELFGRQLPYARFDDFDAVMRDEDQSLKL